MMMASVLPFVGWTLLSWLFVALIRRYGQRIGGIAMPNHRSSHVVATPQGGGLGMVLTACLLISWLWASGQLEGIMLSFFVLSLLLALTGFLDDRYQLPALIRFPVQIAVVGVALVFLEEPALASWLPNWLAFPFALFAGVWWINLFNFMDGIDGLAAIQGMFMFLAAPLLVWLGPGSGGMVSDFHLFFFLAAVILGFLIHNWPPAKIFMGDAGSTWLAFLLFAVAIVTVQRGVLPGATWMILAALFVTDATITLLSRMLRGERWYQAHRSHAYQRLSRRWQGDNKAGHRSVTLLAASVNLFWLFPWAWVNLRWPALSWCWLGLAYLPLIVGVCWTGAGKAE